MPRLVSALAASTFARCVASQIAVIDVYGVVSFAFARRRKEIGIRLAGTACRVSGHDRARDMTRIRPIPSVCSLRQVNLLKGLQSRPRVWTHGQFEMGALPDDIHGASVCKRPANSSADIP